MDSKKHITLASLPLLQGIAPLDIARVLEETQHRETCLSPGESLARQGDECQHLLLLVKGMLKSDRRSPDGLYTFTEYLTAPVVIEPEILYGICRNHAASYTATEECHIISFPKHDVNRMMAALEVFRFNFLNLLSTLAVRGYKAALPTATPDLKARISHFIASHARTAVGCKRLNIRIADLAHYLGVSRAVVSTALHEMEAAGLLHTKRNIIEISEMEKLTLE